MFKRFYDNVCEGRPIPAEWLIKLLEQFTFLSEICPFVLSITNGLFMLAVMKGLFAG